MRFGNQRAAPVGEQVAEAQIVSQIQERCKVAYAGPHPLIPPAPYRVGGRSQTAGRLGPRQPRGFFEALQGWGGGGVAGKDAGRSPMAQALSRHGLLSSRRTTGGRLQCGGGTADLQFLPQRFSRSGKSAPDCLGRLAGSGLQLPRLSGGYALDAPHAFLQQRCALAGCAVRARLVPRKSVKGGHSTATAYGRPPTGPSGSSARPTPMIRTRTTRSGWRRRPSPRWPRPLSERSTL